MTSKRTNFALDICFTGNLPSAYKNSFINAISNVAYEPKGPNPKLVTSPFTEILDVPDYLHLESKEAEQYTVLKKVRQYKGFMVDLTKFNGIEDLLQKRFSRNPRKNLRAKLRNLEKDHKILYQFYWGAIDKEQYDYLFDVCY